MNGGIESLLELKVCNNPLPATACFSVGAPSEIQDCFRAQPKYAPLSFVCQSSKSQRCKCWSADEPSLSMREAKSRLRAPSESGTGSEAGS